MKRLFGALAAALFAMPAYAADPIKMVVPFAAGGPVDALARIVAAEIGPRLQTDVVVENRGGAGGLLAVEQVARAAPDGRTILFASVGAFVITNALKPQAGYEQLKTFAPVARIGAAPTLFIVKADSPVKTLGELIAKAKTDSKMSYGSAGAGTTMHIAAEQLNVAAGTKITHVPYRGIAPALNDIMGGHISFLNGDITVLYPLVKQGTIRALAVAGTERSALLPDVPTAQELGYKDVYMENWYGALVPAATPPDVVAKLEAAMMDAVKNPDVWAKISANGVYAPQDAKTFRAQIEKDVAYWGAGDQEAGDHRRSRLRPHPESCLASAKASVSKDGRSTPLRALRDTCPSDALARAPQGEGSPEPPPIMLRLEIQRRPERHDPARIDVAHADVIVPLDVIHVHRLGDARHLVSSRR